MTGRWINADGLVSTGTGILGHNMFAYCDNNPVMKANPSGYDCICLHQRVHHHECRVWKKQQQLGTMGFKNLTPKLTKDYINTIEKNNINTPELEAQFLAQCAVETAYGSCLIEAEYLPKDLQMEYLSGQNYYPYYGAVYIQITWDYNYKALSEAMGDPNIYTLGPVYVAHNYAWSAAGWFWSNNNINQMITSGCSVDQVSACVNLYADADVYAKKRNAYNRIRGIIG